MSATSPPTIDLRNLDLADLGDRATRLATDARTTAHQMTTQAQRTAGRAADQARAVASTAATRARAYAERVATVAGDYVGAKIKRRVQPPIVIALTVAGAALVVALIAVATRRR